jgi:hypothetical protein
VISIGHREALVRHHDREWLVQAGRLAPRGGLAASGPPTRRRDSAALRSRLALS